MKDCVLRAALVTGLVFATPATVADEVVLQASKDNTLYEDANGALSNGAGSFFFAGRTAQGAGFDIRRGLLAFDLSPVPAGSIITSASLRLVMSRDISGEPRDVSLHRALADWGEGASQAFGNEGIGAAAQAGDATWLHTFYDSDFWTNVGGDYAASPSATVSVGGLAAYVWGSTPDMVADVQAWFQNPSINFGWVVVGDEGAAGTAKRFNTRTHVSSGTRPQLTVGFTPPAFLEDVVPWFGMHLAGTAASLRNSDNQTYDMRSSFGFTSAEPNAVEVRVGFISTGGSTIRITFEGRLDHNGGNTRLRLRNWNTTFFEQVASFPIGTTEITQIFDGISAANRVRMADQRVELSVRQSVVFVFSSAGFRSFTDMTRMVVY